VAEFLSAEWIAALDAAARASTVLTDCAGSESFVLEQRVELASGAEAVHHLVFAPDGTRVLLGAASQPDVVLGTDLPTAVALARGEINAQLALASGHLRVRGDLDALTSRSDALRKIDDVFASVRTETTFPSDERRKTPR
jgi:putative sterol carrier protein